MSRAKAKREQRPDGAYFTPPALAAFLVGLLPTAPGETALEPSAGAGAFSRALITRGLDVESIDLHPGRDPDAPTLLRLVPDPDAPEVVEADFLDPYWSPRTPPDWIVGNPPYSHAQEFLDRSLALTRRHVAFLLRVGFLESGERFPKWRGWPLRHLWVLAERPSFTGGGTDSAAYGFFWFDKRKKAGEPAALEVVSTAARGGRR